MLERKRLLKVKEEVQREGHRVFIYEQAGTGDVFTIVDPGLHLNQLEQVQHDVAALLEHGLNPPVATSAEAEGADDGTTPTASEAPTDPAQSPAHESPEPAATPRE